MASVACAALGGAALQPAGAVAAHAPITACSGTGSAFAGGSGTTASPYQVATAAQLAGITGSYLSCAFVQTADISLSGYASWTPVGLGTGPVFSGTYDGQSHVVTGLVIIERGTYASGLFGKADGASISNLTVSGAAIDQHTATNQRNSNGALIGWALNSEIDNCHSSGSVRGKNDTGGLIGLVYATTITRSSSSARVAGHAWDAGGLVGGSNGTTTITSSSATGTVTNTAFFTGGLVGGAWGSLTVTESYATGDVSFIGSRAPGYVGGWGVGGLVGLANLDSGTISRSFATGDVSGGRLGSGGLVGTAMKLAVIDSFATGDVVGDEMNDGTAVLVGGLVGGTDRDSVGVMSITNSYATGAVTATPAGSGGGLYGGLFQSGSNAPVITNSYWSPENAPAVVSSPYGTPVTNAQLRSVSLFQGARWTIADGWAASGTWGICDGAGTPFLLWRVRASPCAGGTPATDSGGTPAPESGDAPSVIASPASGGTASGAAPTAAATPAARPFMRSGDATQLAGALAVVVHVRQPGTIAIRMTTAARAAGRLICTADLRVRRAGAHTVICRYGTAARAILAAGPVRASVRLAFRAASGRQTIRTSIVLLRQVAGEAPSRVTG